MVLKDHPLFSPCNFNPLNGNHDDDVMFLDESDATFETNIFVVPSKPVI
jgi:hypothetical protein